MPTISIWSSVDDPKFYTHPFTFSRTWVQGAPGGC
jgi:hypothetical protein